MASILPADATAMPPPAAMTALAATIMSWALPPKTVRLWLSWETVVAKAPRHSPQPVSRPTRGLLSARPWR
ncbi:hypothetical protein D9M72_637910 [compost metagenome]